MKYKGKNEEKVLQYIENSEGELEENTDNLIHNEIINGEKSKFYEKLNSIFMEPTSEEGGQNALTGFYFQMLCTLYYMSELLEGKWDFLVFELHQDIIVGNDSKIRFIQVKSKVLPNKPIKQVVTDTGLYNNKWVQKLLAMGKLFPKGQGVITEYELMTNYIIEDSPSVKIEHYLYNNDFNHTVSTDDSLLEKIEYYKLEDKKSNVFDYEKSCGESIRDLLKRFRIVAKALGSNGLEEFSTVIANKLGRKIHESITIDLEDINYLIGELCFSCNHENNKSLMFMDQEKAYGYLKKVEQRIQPKINRYFRRADNHAIIEDIIAKIYSDQESTSNPLKQQIVDEMEQLRKYLIDIVENDSFTVEKMVHRYLEGKSFSLPLKNLPELKIKEKMEEIIKTILILNVLHDNKFKFSMEFKSILMKEAKTSYVSLIGLDGDQTMDEALEKLKNMIEKSSDEEKLLILLKNNNVIFQGEYDDDDIKEKKVITVDQIREYFDPDLFHNEKTIKKVDYRWTIIPGKKITRYFRRIRRHNNITDFKSALQRDLNSMFE